MDKTIVGNNAGKVWCALKEIGEISIPELARRLNLSVESTALAAGWYHMQSLNLRSLIFKRVAP